MEPRREEGNIKLVEELDEFSEVIFFMTGSYVIGYSINNKYIYLPERYIKNVIGAYGVTNHKRALFIYKTVTICEGYFIRKKNWLAILENEEHPEIVSKLRIQL